jgi:hypothetical protein
LAPRTKESLHRELFAALDRTAIKPSAWVDVCDLLAELTGAAGTVLLPIKVEKRRPGVPHSAALQGQFEIYLGEGEWFRRDLRERGLPRMASHGIFVDQDCISEAEMAREAYYEEFLRPIGLRWFAGLGLRIEGDIWCAAVQGTAKRGPFQTSDTEALLAVQTQIEIAAKRSASLGAERAANWADAFEQVGRAVVGINVFSRAVQISPSAEILLCGSELRIRNGRLVAADPDADRQLAASIDAALAYDPWVPRPMPRPVTIRRGRKAMLFVDVLPMPRDYQTLLCDVNVLVLIRELAVAADPVERG